MHTRPLLALGLAACVLTGCSSDEAPSQGTTVAATTAAPAGTTGETAVTTVAAGPTVGRIAGTEFRLGAAFVQYDLRSAQWRVHLLPGTHSCDDELAAVRPAIGFDLPPGNQDELPSTGPLPVLGVTFRQPLGTTEGPLTTTVGVTVVLDAISGTPGGRWTGRVVVAPFDGTGGSYEVDTAFDALVCPPASP